MQPGFDNTWVKTGFICEACSRHETGWQGKPYIPTAGQVWHPVYVEMREGRICRIVNQQEFVAVGLKEFATDWQHARTRRATHETAARGNQVVAALADRIFVAYAAPGSRTETLYREVAGGGKTCLTFDDAKTANLRDDGFGSYHI